MARIRSIKPEFWVDEKIVNLSFPARLLFIGLWNFADDEGRMSYSPKKIKMQIFPADNLDISELFGEIRGESLVHVYSVDSVEYLQVVGFAKHQKIDKRSASKLPPCPLIPPNPPESPRIPTTDQGREGKGSRKALTEPNGSVPKLLLADGLKSNAPVVTTCTVPKAASVENVAAWKGYANAYRQRYEVDPVRNAKVNAQIKQLVLRLGGSEAPQVAAWYVRHNGQLYVRAKHTVDLLLRDCEGLRTEWARGQQVTEQDARHSDRKQSTVNAFGPLIAEAEAREAKEQNHG